MGEHKLEINRKLENSICRRYSIIVALCGRHFLSLANLHPPSPSSPSSRHILIIVSPFYCRISKGNGKRPAHRQRQKTCSPCPLPFLVVEYVFTNSVGVYDESMYVFVRGCAKSSRRQQQVYLTVGTSQASISISLV